MWNDIGSAATDRDFWDIFDIVAGAFAAIFIPAVIGLVGHWVSRSISKRETQARTMALAVDILKSEPALTGVPIRTWAIDVLDRFSGVHIASDVREELSNRTLSFATEVEREISDEVASYGKQLGRVMDLLIDVSERTDGVDENKLQAVAELKQQIEEVKIRHAFENEYNTKNSTD